MARAFARDQADAMVDRLTAARSTVAEGMQMTPTRAFQVMVGQIAQTRLGGRSGIIERRDVANRAIGRAQQEMVAATSLRQQSIQTAFELATERAQATPDPARVDELRDQLIARNKATRAQEALAEKKAGLAETAAGKVVTPGVIARSLAVGGVSILGAGVLFTAAMQVTQIAMEGLTKAVETSIDAMSGFALTANRITAQFAQGVRQAGGAQFARQVVQQQAGMLGVPAGVDLAPLIERARIETGNLNLRDAIDIMRANESVRGQAFGTRVRGLTRATGGFDIGDMNFGGTPSTAEQMTHVLNAEADIFDRQMGAAPLGGLRDLVSDLVGGGEFGEWLAGPTGTWDKIREESEKANEQWFNTFNDYAAKAGSGYGKILTDQGQTAVNETWQAWRDAGLNAQQATRLTTGGRSLAGVTGDREASRQLALSYIEGVNVGAGIPDRTRLQAAATDALANAFGSIQLQGEFRRREVIPENLSFQLMQRPLQTPGTGLLTGNTPAGDVGTLRPFVDEVARYQSITRTLADDSWLAKLTPEGRNAVSMMQQLASEAQHYNEIAANIQTSFANTQWEHQTEITLRQAGEMVGLLGEQERTVRIITGYTKEGAAIEGDQLVKASELGKLRREQIDLSREDQRIQLAIAQRQINFNRSLAMIEVPGATPAEMAARVSNQMLLAQEEQEALDRQVRLRDVSIRIEDIELTTQATDFLDHTLPQYFQGHAVEVSVKGLQAASQAAQDTATAWGTFADSFKTDQQAMDQAVVDSQLAIETTLNSFATEFHDEIELRILDFQTQYTDWLGTLPLPTVTPSQDMQYPLDPDGGVAPGDFGGGNSGGGGGGSGEGYATGAWAVPSDRTARLHAGEMVIPANQAAWMRGQLLGASVPARTGGGVTVININNPTVRDDSDLDAIARRVEQVMNRRAAAAGVGPSF